MTSRNKTPRTELKLSGRLSSRAVEKFGQQVCEVETMGQLHPKGKRKRTVYARI